MCAKGWRVQVLEKLNEPGGRARVIRVDGYTFDAGPTIITVPFLLEDLWELAGRKLADDIELRLLDPFTGSGSTMVITSTTAQTPSVCAMKCCA